MLKLREPVCRNPACLPSACFTAPNLTVCRIGLGCVWKLQYRVLSISVHYSDDRRDQSIQS